MPTVQPFPAGGYRFISHQFQYSGGVAAEPGCWGRMVFMGEGGFAIGNWRHLESLGRPPQGDAWLCAAL
ncbi:MAG: hypothetical protein WCB44_09860 [Stellaceae bacterium]